MPHQKWSLILFDSGSLDTLWCDMQHKYQTPIHYFHIILLSLQWDWDRSTLLIKDVPWGYYVCLTFLAGRANSIPLPWQRFKYNRERSTLSLQKTRERERSLWYRASFMQNRRMMRPLGALADDPYIHWLRQRHLLFFWVCVSNLATHLTSRPEDSGLICTESRITKKLT